MRGAEIPESLQSLYYSFTHSERITTSEHFTAEIGHYKETCLRPEARRTQYTYCKVSNLTVQVQLSSVLLCRHHCHNIQNRGSTLPSDALLCHVYTLIELLHQSLSSLRASSYLVCKPEEGTSSYQHPYNIVRSLFLQSETTKSRAAFACLSHGHLLHADPNGQQKD